MLDVGEKNNSITLGSINVTNGDNELDQFKVRTFFNVYKMIVPFAAVKYQEMFFFFTEP